MPVLVQLPPGLAERSAPSALAKHNLLERSLGEVRRRTKVKITDRKELGMLWLAWCIDRDYHDARRADTLPPS
jgi:hypothetical protein